MASKWTLNIAAMQEEFFADSALIGISSSLPAYQFCWMLNERFDMNFVREPELDIVVQGSAGEDSRYYSLYQYCAPLNGSRYLLYKLKSDKQSLLPEIKNLDYLWMIQSPTHDKDARTVTSYLKQMPDVQLAQMIPPAKLKHLNNLLV